MGKKKVLFVGESVVCMLTEIKGVDQFTISEYKESVEWVERAFRNNGVEMVHMPCHRAMHDFPTTAEQLSEYDAVMFSDVGYNTIMLHPDTSMNCKRTPNRLAALKEYVEQGGAFMMIGGWMSFSGFEGKAHYKGSLVEEILPVELMVGDDRVEIPEGLCPEVKLNGHEILKGIDEPFPFFLSYNKLIPKQGAQVISSFPADPFLVVWDYGKGRTAAMATDCAPHGAPPEFLNWKYFDTYWGNIVNWLCKE